MTASANRKAAGRKSTTGLPDIQGCQTGIWHELRLREEARARAIAEKYAVTKPVRRTFIGGLLRRLTHANPLSSQH